MLLILQDESDKSISDDEDTSDGEWVDVSHSSDENEDIEADDVDDDNDNKKSGNEEKDVTNCVEQEKQEGCKENLNSTTSENLVSNFVHSGFFLF